MTIPDTIPTTDFHDKRIALANWFPRVQALDVPVPETHEVPLDHDTDGLPELDTDRAVDIVNSLGGKAFARTDFKSAYDLREGSYVHVATPQEVDRTLSILISSQAMMQMPLGGQVYLRDFVDLDWGYDALGTLHPEIRVFIRGGEIICYHPRLEWEENEDYRHHLTATKHIIECLWDEKVREYANCVAKEFKHDIGYSVDFVVTSDHDCYLTDMAVDALYERDGHYRNVSAHPDNCPHDYENQL